MAAGTIATASSDERVKGRQGPVARLQFAQQTFPEEGVAALTADLYVNGTIMAMEFVVAETEDNITYTIALTNENGAALFSEGTLADLSTHWRDARSHKSTRDADFNPIPINGTLTATITPSGKPDDSNVGTHIATVDVILYVI